MDHLNQNELEALGILWNHGEAKPAEIEGRFSWPIDNGTLRSVLRVLMDKKLITRRKVGRAYVYKATRSPQNVLSQLTKRLSKVFAGGSATSLIAQLIELEKLGPEDIQELQRIAEENAGKPPSRRGGGGK